MFVCFVLCFQLLFFVDKFAVKQFGWSQTLVFKVEVGVGGRHCCVGVCDLVCICTGIFVWYVVIESS